MPVILVFSFMTNSVLTGLSQLNETKSQDFIYSNLHLKFISQKN